MASEEFRLGKKTTRMKRRVVRGDTTTLMGMMVGRREEGRSAFLVVAEEILLRLYDTEHREFGASYVEG